MTKLQEYLNENKGLDDVKLILNKNGIEMFHSDITELSEEYDNFITTVIKFRKKYVKLYEQVDDLLLSNVVLNEKIADGANSIIELIDAVDRIDIQLFYKYFDGRDQMDNMIDMLKEMNKEIK